MPIVLGFKPVHPRTCGEHYLNKVYEYFTGGSSPHLRGTRTNQFRIDRHERFIPAPAGNTAMRTPMVDVPSVHPRTCGEHE